MRVRGNSRKHAVKQALQSARIQAAPAPALANTTDEFPLRESKSPSSAAPTIRTMPSS
jgi:hypothetical protein